MKPFSPSRASWRPVVLAVVLVSVLVLPLYSQETLEALPSRGSDKAATAESAVESALPWWGWSLILFVFCFALGIVAVMAGIGGGVLYVPLVASFFPFHIDFVRATGLLMALSGALAAGPGLLKRGLTNLRLVLPCALFASLGGLAGAVVGLRMNPRHVQLALGLCILAIVAIMLLARNVEFPRVERSDRLSAWLGLQGIYHEASSGQTVRWRIHRMPVALLLFIGVGFLAGMFGLGAGWANLPVLNLVLGVPLKMAVGSSVFMLSITDTTAAWVYMKNGCWMPVMAIPSIAGLMLGTSIGVKFLSRTRPRSIRYLVIVVMILAGLRSLMKGFGI